MTDKIERHINLDAPIDRVWTALTDHEQFGAWFRVRLEGPFVVGQEARGRIAYEGYEHLVWRARVVAMDRPERFAFTWHPYAVDPDVDYSQEEPTLVEFRLEPAGQGTRLTVSESGFDKIPQHRREEALRMNGNGWSIQMENVRAHVDG